MEILKNTRHKISVKYNPSAGPTLENKMIVSTRPGIWKNTNQPVILPFSIHSAIYDGIAGYFKVSAFLSAIKSNVNGKVIVLMCEGAHVNVLSLKYQNDINKAFNICSNDAVALVERFTQNFVDCDVVYWKNFIREDENYNQFKRKIMHLFETSENVKASVKNDVEKSYTNKIAKEFPNRVLYDVKVELDFFEIILSIKIMYEKGCKILFYPGPMPSSVESFRPHLFPEMTFVNVSIKRSKKGDAR